MNMLNLGSAYLIISAALLLILAQVNQKPFCINSQAIEKITIEDGSVFYRCSARKRVSYSDKFHILDQVFISKIQPFENWLKAHWQLRKFSRQSVKILSQPVVTQIQGSDLIIWNQNLRNTFQLETEIAKFHLRKLNPSFFESNELALGSLSEFIVKVWSQNSSNSYGGLSSFVAHQFWQSFEQLGMKDKIQVLSTLPSVVKKMSPPARLDTETQNYDQIVGLLSAFSQNEKFHKLLRSRNAFEAGSLVASFDYLVMMEKVRPNLIKSLQKAQVSKPQLNIGLWDGQNLYDLGSRSQISSLSFSKLKVRSLVWESCNDLSIHEILSVQAEVQKILVVRSCSAQNQPDYSEYIRNAVAGFAASHPQVSFVQLDVPSLNLRKDSSILQQRVFEIMTQQMNLKENRNHFFSLYGLEKLQWDQELQIFSPKAHVDAVEHFRVTTN